MERVGHVPGKWCKICHTKSTLLAKYQVNSLRGFIRSSLEYVALVIKPIILNCKIQQCLRVVLRVVPSWCRSMRRAVSSCRSPACWLLAINKWRSNSPTFGIFWSSLVTLVFKLLHDSTNCIKLLYRISFYWPFRCKRTLQISRDPPGRTPPQRAVRLASSRWQPLEPLRPGRKTLGNANQQNVSLEMVNQLLFHNQEYIIKIHSIYYILLCKYEISSITLNTIEWSVRTILSNIVNILSIHQYLSMLAKEVQLLSTFFQGA